MAAARKVEVDCEAPFAVVAAHTVEVRAAEVFEQAGGVLDLGEVEHVHDMRVATRRLRAALEVFAACFPRKRHRKTLKRVKALADALGERRDLDVEIELLEGLGDEIDAGDREAFTALLEERRAKQQVANQALAAYVTSKRLKKLRRQLHELVEEAGR